LIKSGRRFEAFQIAKDKDKIDEYCKYVGKVEEKEAL